MYPWHLGEEMRPGEIRSRRTRRSRHALIPLGDRYEDQMTNLQPLETGIECTVAKFREQL